MENKAKIITVAGKGGVGKTSPFLFLGGVLNLKKILGKRISP